jgi:hypothetical protein
MSGVADAKQDRKDKRRRGRAQSVQPADWASADPLLLVTAICAVAKTGGALRFGYSRDGGAYSIGVYGDGQPYTLWCRPGDTDEVTRTLTELIEDFED